jgi:hypothetical protein
MFEPAAGVAPAALSMIVFRVWLMELQAAVPVAGPVVLLADGAGLLAALVSCALPLLLQPATAAAAIATAPIASFFLIACSSSGPAGVPGADPSRYSTLSDDYFTFCVHPRWLMSAASQDATCLNRCTLG